MFEALVYLVEPIFNFGDELFITGQEETELGLTGAQIAANQTQADAALTTAQDAATFTEDEQRQLGIIILAVIVLVFIIGIFYTINKS